MSKFLSFKVFAIALILFLGGFVFSKNIFSSVANYTGSGFAQFCAENSTICTKEDSNTASCPTEGQVIEEVYVHAGDGQTVYLLPDAKWSTVFSNNNNTVTVSPVGKQHDISWVGVV